MCVGLLKLTGLQNTSKKQLNLKKKKQSSGFFLKLISVMYRCSLTREIEGGRPIV